MELTKAFADSVRTSLFDGELTQEQVSGMSVILNAWAVADMRWLAYVLATVYWETARTMQPVIETFNPAHDTVNPSVETAIARLDASYAAGRLTWVHTPYWRKDVNGFSWLGRGYAQVTHKENYLRAEQETGIKFTADPSLMLVPEHAVLVLISGMINGWFTGKKLRNYVSPVTGTFLVHNARQIINGFDHAGDIADVHVQFLKALQGGLVA